MKIGSIQSYGYNQPVPQKSNKKEVKTYNQGLTSNSIADYGRDLLSFKSKSGMIEEIVAKTSFEDKLAVAFSMIRPNELLVVSQNKEILSRVLPPIADKISGAITKIQYMQEKGIQETLVFVRNIMGNSFLFNVNNRPFVINGMEAVLPDDSVEIRVNDHIRLSGQWIEIKPESDADFELDKYTNLFIKTYENSSNLADIIKNYNSKFFTTVGLNKPNKSDNNITFDAVGGQDENIQALKKNVLYPMKYPEVFKGFMLNRGVILAGPPGTGKTLLAKALISEAGAASFELCATDLSDKYVGESEKNCRELFQKAVDAQPSIIYFDEFDALAKSRGSQDVYGDKLLNQLLSLMSDLEKRGDNVYVIASTNKKDAIDSAILRSGRFGLQLECKPPDLDGVEKILDIHLKGKPVDEDLNRKELAQKMFDKKMTGAGIADAVKRAFSHTLDRTEIYKSMENDSFSPAMMSFLKITEADFNKALEEFNVKEERRYIGFKR